MRPTAAQRPCRPLYVRRLPYGRAAHHHTHHISSPLTPPESPPPPLTTTPPGLAPPTPCPHAGTFIESLREYAWGLQGGVSDHPARADEGVIPTEAPQSRLCTARSPADSSYLASRREEVCRGLQSQPAPVSLPSLAPSLPPSLPPSSPRSSVVGPSGSGSSAIVWGGATRAQSDREACSDHGASSDSRPLSSPGVSPPELGRHGGRPTWVAAPPNVPLSVRPAR